MTPANIAATAPEASPCLRGHENPSPASGGPENRLCVDPAPVPTWRECHAAGMTAQQAANHRNAKLHAAYSWATATGNSWAPAERPRGQSLPTELLLILLSEGKTGRQAATITGRAYRSLIEWARARGLSWARDAKAAPVRRVTKAEPPPQPAQQPTPHIRRMAVATDCGFSSQHPRRAAVSLRKEPWL